MIKFFGLVLIGGCEVNSKLFDDVDVNLRKNNGGVHFASFKLRQLFHCKRCGGISYRANRECNKYFVGMKSGVVVTQILGF